MDTENNERCTAMAPKCNKPIICISVILEAVPLNNEPTSKLEVAWGMLPALVI
jgi:hypothetical protein